MIKDSKKDFYFSQIHSEFRILRTYVFQDKTKMGGGGNPIPLACVI